MRRTVKKQFWLSEEEAEMLKEKAQRTCLSEVGLIRKLLTGFLPKEKPDDRFYQVMEQMTAIGNNLDQLLVKANALNFIDVPFLEREAKSWRRFQVDVRKKFTLPDKAEEWQ